MAAASANMRNFLSNVIGISNATGTDINARRQAVMDEGLSVMDDLIEFDDEDIKVLCASVRKPGGTIIDPANANNTIPNPGHSIPAIAEKRLKLACYASKIYNILDRPLTADILSRSRLRQFEQHQVTINEHREPEQMPQISKTFGIMKALDMFPIHLRERIGTRKIALAYVIRGSATPEPLEALQANSITSPNYDSLMDELIARAPHAGTEFNEDNAKVYQVLQDLVAGSSHESSIKSFRKARDGRGAYLALVQHNLGSSKWDRIIDSCESYLLQNEWNGKNVRFTLKMHVSKHREAHNELVRASQFVSYEVPNEHTRVSRLIKSITSKDGAILAAIAFIQGTLAMRGDFENAADYLLLTAPSPKEIERSYRISATSLSEGKANSNNRDNSNGVGSTGAQLRYYAKAEYDGLTGKQKKELHEWRKSKSRNNATKGGDANGDAKISLLQTKINDLIKANEEMQSQISSLKVKDGSECRNPLSNPLNQRNS